MTQMFRNADYSVFKNTINACKVLRKKRSLVASKHSW